MSKAQITNTFNLVAPTFDRAGPQFFTLSGRHLVELAHLPKGASVLDVATGRGAVLLPASDRVGQSGPAIGVDRSMGMLREFARDVRLRHYRRVTLCQMDAERLGFGDGSFDFVLCGHAIYYFPQAVREFHRVLKPGGQAGMTIVAKGSLDWVFEILDPHPPEEDDGEDVGSIAINTAVGLEKVLSDAGFEGIRVVDEKAEFVYVDEEEWWSTLWTWGVRLALEKIETGAIESLKEEMFDYLQAFKQPDGVHVLIRVLYVLGSKVN